MKESFRYHVRRLRRVKTVQLIFVVLNPLDKVVEHYKRSVQAEKDKVEYLEKLIKLKYQS